MNYNLEEELQVVGERGSLNSSDKNVGMVEDELDYVQIDEEDIQEKAMGVEKVALLDKGVFLVQFLTMENRGKLLARGRIFFDHKPVFLKAWQPDMDISREDLTLGNITDNYKKKIGKRRMRQRRRLEPQALEFKGLEAYIHGVVEVRQGSRDLQKYGGTRRSFLKEDKGVKVHNTFEVLGQESCWADYEEESIEIHIVKGGVPPD
ncbi:FIP1[III]-like protein [Bienertia sinuspersici]